MPGSEKLLRAEDSGQLNDFLERLSFSSTLTRINAHARQGREPSTRRCVRSDAERAWWRQVDPEGACFRHSTAHLDEVSTYPKSDGQETRGRWASAFADLTTPRSAWRRTLVFARGLKTTSEPWASQSDRRNAAPTPVRHN